ncbi:MAG: hypothetical protein QF524_03635, partial [Planctomycetota bacterium]|nr:hypothetical protein [Planctomycetota bacterium]
MLSTLLAFTLPIAFAPFQSSVEATVRATPFEEPFQIDGRLSEKQWQAAALAGPLTEVEPVEGIPHDPFTEIRVARDSTHLYFGITCWEPTPEKMVVQNMKRDAYLKEDDRIEVVLDT